MNLLKIKIENNNSKANNIYKIYEEILTIINQKYKTDEQFQNSILENEIEEFAWDIATKFLCENTENKSDLLKHINLECEKLVNIKEKEIPLKDIYFYSSDYLTKNEMLKQFMNDLFKTLNDKEMFIIKERFFNDKTYKEIGEELGITNERIRQIEAKVLKKLRLPKYHLSPYYKEI